MAHDIQVAASITTADFGNLYRVVRKHAGGAGPNGVVMKFQTLFEKSGAEGTYRRFKFELMKILRHSDIAYQPKA